MLRHSVRLATALPVVVFFACSDAATKLAAPRDNAVTSTATVIPYATGVHTAVIPALDPVFNAGGQATAINDGGEIVGTRVGTVEIGNTDVDSDAAISWTSHYGLKVLPLAANNNVVGAFGVNNNGQVALTYPGPPAGDTQPIPNIAAIWDWFGGLHRLPLLSSYSIPSAVPPAYPRCNATAINASGVVVGDCEIVTGPNGFLSNPIATVWTRFGTPWAITGKAVQATIAAMSDAGYIAGGPVYGFGSNAFLFSPSEQETVLPNPSGQTTIYAEALAVNNTGAAAGFRLRGDPACGGSTASQPVVWLTPDSAIDIPTCGSSVLLNGVSPQVMATGISDDGIVVGVAYDSVNVRNDRRFAFVWTPATGLQRLPGVEGGIAKQQESSGAVAINHHHQVVGWVINQDQGYQHTVVWTLPAGTTP